MKDYPSAHELYYNRWITPLLINALKEAPVLVLTGVWQAEPSILNWTPLTLGEIHQNPLPV
ncbi:MAG: hypothetical protein WA116_08085 [Anaerolineaceae bacterium]